MKNGVYYLPIGDKLILVSRAKEYEDRVQTFSILHWEDQYGCWDKVLITKDQYKRFIYLGPLI